jgi:hypothetical protein
MFSTCVHSPPETNSGAVIWRSRPPLSYRPGKAILTILAGWSIFSPESDPQESSFCNLAARGNGRTETTRLTFPPRPGTETRQTHDFGQIYPMAFDIRARLILRLIREGNTYVDVAFTLRISRQAIHRRIQRNPDFATAIAEAREEGRPNRERGLWYWHPFRGKRPPTGKGHGGKPRFNGKKRKLSRWRG